MQDVYKMAVNKMKLFRKSLMMLTGTLLLVCAVLGMVACNQSAQYKLTLDFDGGKGAVTATDYEEGKTYEEGTKITVTVTPAEGYEVDTFTVSGHADASLSGGKYTFEIEADTTVAVTFKDKAPDVPVSYGLTLVFDETGGAVTATDYEEGKTYEEGTKITVTVTPAEGYEVDTFTVSGHADASLSGGKYTFEIGAETTVTVTFKQKKLSDALLKSIQGSVLFDGTFINHDYSFEDELTEEISTLFDAAAQAIWQTEKFGGGYTFNAVYVNNNGKIGLVVHNADGTVGIQSSTDDFADFFNPFAQLTTDDFAWAGAGKWELLADKASDAAAAITGYNEKIASFTLLEEDGAITGLQIKTERVTNVAQGIDYETEYTYAAKEQGTAQIPAEWLHDYQMTAAHEALKTALERAAQAESYTVTEHREEEGQPPVDGTIYVTADAIYEDLPDWENGYVASEGKVYPFGYDKAKNTFTFDEAYSADIGIDDLKAVFTFGNLSYALLGYDGNETYSVRIPDLFIMDEAGELAGAIASLFAIGADQIQYYPYALDFTVILKDGVLYQTVFTYDLMGYIIEKVTLTYSGFGETVQPIEIPAPPAETASIPEKYIGKYSGAAADGTEYEIDITAEEITVSIDGVKSTATIDEYTDSEGFVLTVEGETYYLFQSYGTEEETVISSIMFMSEDYQTNVTLTREGGSETDPPAESSSIPAKFIGKYSGSDNGTEYEIDITAEEITVTIDGTKSTAAIDSYDDYEGFTLTVGGKTYYLTQADYEEEITIIAFMSEDYRTVNVTLTREGGSETDPPTDSSSIPEKFIGKYSGAAADGTAYEIEITAEEITVSIGGVQSTATINDYTDSEGFVLTVNGGTYYLSQTIYDEEITVTKVLFMSEDYSTMVTLTRTN